jgi:hypothetical protein
MLDTTLKLLGRLALVILIIASILYLASFLPAGAVVIGDFQKSMCGVSGSEPKECAVSVCYGSGKYNSYQLSAHRGLVSVTRLADFQEDAPSFGGGDQTTPAGMEWRSEHRYYAFNWSTTQYEGFAGVGFYRSWQFNLRLSYLLAITCCVYFIFAFFRFCANRFGAKPGAFEVISKST